MFLDVREFDFDKAVKQYEVNGKKYTLTEMVYTWYNALYLLPYSEACILVLLCSVANYDAFMKVKEDLYLRFPKFHSVMDAIVFLC